MKNNRINIIFGEFKGQTVSKASVVDGAKRVITTMVKNKPVSVCISVDPPSLLEDKTIYLEPSLALDLPKENYPSVPKVTLEPLVASYTINNNLVLLQFKIGILTRDQQNIPFRLRLVMYKKISESNTQQILAHVYSDPLKVVSKPPKKQPQAPKSTKIKEEEKESSLKRKRSEMEEENAETTDPFLQKMYTGILSNATLLNNINSSINQLREAFISQSSSKSFSQANNNIVLPICFPPNFSLPSNIANPPLVPPVSSSSDKKRKLTKQESEDFDSLGIEEELDDEFQKAMNLKPTQEEEGIDEPAAKKRALSSSPSQDDRFSKFASALDNFIAEDEETNIEQTAETLHKHFSTFSSSKKEKLVACFKELIVLEEKPIDEDWNKFPGFAKPCEWNYSDILDFPSSNQFVDNFFLDKDI
jgi:hypothetical protein